MIPNAFLVFNTHNDSSIFPVCIYCDLEQISCWLKCPTEDSKARQHPVNLGTGHLLDYSHGNPQLERHGVRVELGWFQTTASGYYQLGDSVTSSEIYTAYFLADCSSHLWCYVFWAIFFGGIFESCIKHQKVRFFLFVLLVIAFQYETLVTY